MVNGDFLKISFTFHLVSKQVDIPCDGIFGRDFFEKAGIDLLCVGDTDVRNTQ